jgi:hypothetical protein
MKIKNQLIHYLFFIYSFEIGLLLIFLPWLDLWERNFTLLKINYISEIMKNLYVRGAISGLGIVSIIIAFIYEFPSKIS